MFVIIISLIVFFLSFILNLLLYKNSYLKAIFNDCHYDNRPQRFHYNPTPRAGGIGIFFAFLVVSIINLFFRKDFNIILLSLCAIPVFSIGLYEDIKSSHLSPWLRLLLMISGATISVVLIDNSVVYNIGIKLPVWIAIPFTVLGIITVSNAINIIDGFNGLSGGVSIIALINIAVVSIINGDSLIFIISFILIFAIMGFFVLNFPKGKIFLGDGGAYFIGFMLAEISILLVNRNINISPWFPVVVLSYPIFEVFFSIYRKKFKRGGSAFLPDKVHLHMLVYKRITRNNPKTSAYLWILVIFFNFFGFLSRSNTLILIIIFIIFSFIYIYLYRKIVKFGRLFSLVNSL